MKEKITADNLEITPEEMARVPIGSLAQYSPRVLYRLQKSAIYNIEHARHCRQWIEAAIGMKYQDKDRVKRLRLEKESGVIHIDDMGYRLTSDVKKRVMWDQERLAAIAAGLEAMGEQPCDYMEITRHVPERMYENFTENLRETFDAARQIALNNPTYKLTPIGDQRL